MSKLLEAVMDIASKLDPDIDLGLGSEFGDDWQKQLNKELGTDTSSKYTVKQLKDLVRKYKIKGRSKLKNEDQLIKALLNAGVKL